MCRRGGTLLLLLLVLVVVGVLTLWSCTGGHAADGTGATRSAASSRQCSTTQTSQRPRLLAASLPLRSLPRHWLSLDQGGGETLHQRAASTNGDRAVQTGRRGEGGTFLGVIAGAAKETSRPAGYTAMGPSRRERTREGGNARASE